MSNQVREKRLQAGISGEELARRARLSASDLSKVERGQRLAFPAWRRRIAEALDLPEEELFPREADLVAG